MYVFNFYAINVTKKTKKKTVFKQVSRTLRLSATEWPKR